MRPLLKLYIALVGVAAIALLGHDLSVLALWPYSWSFGVTIALMVLTALGDHLQFEVRRGWYTNASAVAHVAAAFLLPHGLAAGIAALGVVIRANKYNLPLPKTDFTISNICIADDDVSHVAPRLSCP